MAPIAPPPRLLDVEPPVLWGASKYELMRWTALSAVTWTPILVVGFGAAGYWPGAIGATFAMVALSVYLIAYWAQRRRRGRPQSHDAQRTLLMRQRLGLAPAVLITRSGPWSLGRTR